MRGYKIIGKSINLEYGAKAQSLIELSKLDLTPYFILLTDDFLNNFFKINQKTVWLNEILKIQKSIEKVNILELLKILNPILSINKKYIIRSSYKYEDSKKSSFAGIFKSLIANRIEDIPSKITEVYLSMFSERFYSYYLKTFKTTKLPICMNIIIQEYIQPISSGVVFTYKGKNTFYIEESSQKDKTVEEGNIVPLQIVVDNGIPYEILGNHIEKFDNDIENDWIYYLTKNIKKIPDYKRHPLDVEYVLDKNKKIHIVQYRPVTREINLNDFYVYLFSVKYNDSNLKILKKFIINSFFLFFNKKITIPLIKGNDVYIKFKDYSGIINKEIKKIKKMPDYHLKLYIFYLKNLNKTLLPGFSLIDSIFFSTTYTIILNQINDKLNEYFGNILFFKLKLDEKNLKPQSYYVSKLKGKNLKPAIINYQNKTKRISKIMENIILMHDIFDYYYTKLTENFHKFRKNLIKFEFYPAPIKIESKENGFSSMQRPLILNGNVFSKYNLPCSGTAIKDNSIKNNNICKNSIIVLETFSPSNVPLLVQARAVITKEGGYLSHAAIVARELKKPAIGNVNVELIQNGEKIKILKDGKIYLTGQKSE